MHPAKYLAGELPIPVAPPSAPQGWKLVTTGRLGELQLGVFLDQCAAVDAPGPEQAVGWGGDAYAIVVSGDRIGILLATAWDDEPSAIRFEAAVAARASCVASLEGLNAKVGRAVAVSRDGARVAYTQGLTQPEADIVLRALLKLPGEAPAKAPPLGDVKIPPDALPEERFFHRGVVDDARVYTNAPLGLRVALPATFDAYKGSASSAIELVMKRDAPSSAWAALGVELSRATPVAMDATAKAGLEALRKKPAIAHAKVEDLRRADIALPSGVATMYLLRMDNGWRASTVIAPVCNDHAMLVVYTLAQDDDAQIALGRWLRTLGVARSSEACAYVSE
jgi:hypothetical protein